MAGSQSLRYADLETLASNAVGGIAGDALPLFNSASIARNNAGIGRHFRSRFSLSPMSEGSNIDGGWVNAFRAATVISLTGFNTTYANGGTDATSGLSRCVAFSRELALIQADPFTASVPFSQDIVDYTMQRNAGSVLRRKPKLNVVIV